MKQEQTQEYNKTEEQTQRYKKTEEPTHGQYELRTGLASHLPLASSIMKSLFPKSINEKVVFKFVFLISSYK